MLEREERKMLYKTGGYDRIHDGVSILQEVLNIFFLTLCIENESLTFI